MVFLYFFLLCIDQAFNAHFDDQLKTYGFHVRNSISFEPSLHFPFSISLSSHTQTHTLSLLSFLLTCVTISIISTSFTVSQLLVSLVGLSGREQLLGNAYKEQVLLHASSDLNFIAFDFHRECKGTNVSLK
jgi:hypothetical protein